MGTSRAAAGQRAERYAENAKDQPALAWPARVGFVCYGLVYLVLGWLAAELALGRASQPISGTGAFDQLAHEPLGHVVVWLAAGGFAALVVWEACQAVGGHRDQHGLRRLGGRTVSACRGAIFAGLGVTAARTGLHHASAGGASGSQQGITARVLAQPWGPWLVGAIGAGLLIFAVHSIYGGVTGSWRQQIDADGRSGASGAVITWLARVGYVARGIAFGIMGGFVVWAALSHDPQHSRGLDQALEALRRAPAGPALLLGVAAGLACYGVFNATKVVFLRDV